VGQRIIDKPELPPQGVVTGGEARRENCVEARFTGAIPERCRALTLKIVA